MLIFKKTHCDFPLFCTFLMYQWLQKVESYEDLVLVLPYLALALRCMALIVMWDFF